MPIRNMGFAGGEHMDTGSDLLEQIYAAAVEPEHWPAVVNSLQERFRCHSAGLYTSDLDRHDVGLIHLSGMDPTWVKAYVDHHMLDNPWLAVPPFQLPGVIRTDESLDRYYKEPGYYRGTVFFNEWMKPQQYDHSLGATLYRKGPLSTKIVMYRRSAAGAIGHSEEQQFRELVCHLSRSVGLARRLALKQAGIDTASGVIDSLDLGMIFLDDQMRVIQANRFAERMFRRHDGLRLGDGRLRGMHRGDQRGLDAAVQGALAVHLGLSAELPQGACLQRGDGRRPLRLTAIPLPRQASDPFMLRHAAVVLMIIDPELEAQVAGEWLQRRYGLSCAESRLVQSLLQGVCLREAAEKNQLTYETARSYLKIIFQKTGASRQSELVSLLLRERAGSSPETTH